MDYHQSLNFQEVGIASWYGKPFHGRKTSNGEIYDMYALTAAHPTLPLPSQVEITNLENGKKVVVRVNDRGPFKKNRIIDLSYAAAHTLDIIGQGTAKVEIRVLTSGPTYSINNGKQYMQIGAFLSRENADALKRRMRKLLDSNIVIMQSQTEPKLYKVRVGPIRDLEHAKSLHKQLSQYGTSPIFVTDQAQADF